LDSEEIEKGQAEIRMLKLVIPGLRKSWSWTRAADRGNSIELKRERDGRTCIEGGRDEEEQKSSPKTWPLPKWFKLVEKN
jgi:hypothetical protein